MKYKALSQAWTFRANRTECALREARAMLRDRLSAEEHNIEGYLRQGDLLEIHKAFARREVTRAILTRRLPREWNGKGTSWLCGRR